MGRGDPRAVFFLAVLVGALCVVGVGTILEARVLGVVCAVAVMVAYGFWVWRRTDGVHDLEQYGDSFYYLGFILTLVSLASSVIPKMGQEAASLDILNITTQFGTGLITTVVGLSGKLMLSQFASPPVATLEQAQQETSRALLAMTLEVQETQRHLQEMRKQSESEFGNLTRESIRSIHTLSEQMKDSVEHMWRQLGGQIDQLLKDTQKQTEENSEVLRKVLTELSREAGDVNTAIKGIAIASKKLVTNTENYGLKLDEALNAIGSQTIKEIAQAVGELNVKITKVAEVWSRLGSVMQGYEGLLKTNLDQAHHLLSDIEDILAKSKERRSALEIELKKAEDAMALVHHNLIANSEFIIKRLG